MINLHIPRRAIDVAGGVVEGGVVIAFALLTAIITARVIYVWFFA